MEARDLVDGLKARNNDAFSVFWEEYFEKIYPICAYILGDGPDALDATVDLMVDFIETHLNRLTKPESLYGYLRLMAIRRSLRLKDKRQKSVPLKTSLAATQYSAEELVALKQLVPILDECLTGITPKARKALRLKYSSSISNEQIGHFLGGSKQYIGRLIRNSLEVLRDCIENRRGKAPTVSSEGGS